MNKIVLGLVWLIVVSFIVTGINKYPDQSLIGLLSLIIILIGYWLINLENNTDS